MDKFINEIFNFIELIIRILLKSTKHIKHIQITDATDADKFLTILVKFNLFDLLVKLKFNLSARLKFGLLANFKINLLINLKLLLTSF